MKYIEAVQNIGFNLMILMETNITYQEYFHNSLGYNIVCFSLILTATDEVQGGVCLDVWIQPQVWIVELMRFHRPNVASCKVVTVTNRKKTPTIGTYLPPSTMDHLPDLEEDLTRFWYHDLIVLWDLRSNIGQAQNPHNQQIADLIMYFMLMDILLNFCQHWWLRNMNKWYQVRQGRTMKSKSDYIGLQTGAASK